jgi:hypothetical protein
MAAELFELGLEVGLGDAVEDAAPAEAVVVSIEVAAPTFGVLDGVDIVAELIVEELSVDEPTAEEVAAELAVDDDTELDDAELDDATLAWASVKLK